MSNTVITWKQGNYSKYGYVGKVKMFSYVYGMERGSNTPWQLRTSLPGIKKDTVHATPEACEETAETMLKIHLNSLIKAGVQLPKVERIDAALDTKQLEETAKAIARVALRTEAEGTDEEWDAYWGMLPAAERLRSEEHTSELQSLLGISYAVSLDRKSVV